MLSRFRLPHTLALVALLAALALPLVGASAPVDCAPEFHDRFYATAPDGYVYPTWHPAVDPATGCAYGHEHGTDPAAVVAPAPLYGYVAARAGLREPHDGFKSFGFRDDAGRGWLVSVHQGTRGAARACVRFHSLDLAVTGADGEVLAHVHALADFGGATANIIAPTALIPTACPHQHQSAALAGSMGFRHLPVAALGAARMYEPWRADTRSSALGLLFAELTVTVLDPETSCVDLTCDAVAQTGRAGVQRTLGLGGGFVLSAAPGREGAYWTEPGGRTVVSVNAHDAVAQWLAPGLSLTPFGRPVTCQPGPSVYDCGGRMP